MTLNDIVQDLIRKHTGGQQFFDALDNEVRNHPHLLHKLLELRLQWVEANSLVGRTMNIVSGS